MAGFYDTSTTAFVVITVILGGGAAWMSGRAVAHAWESALTAALYMIPLAAAVRFLHYALADGTAPATLATPEALILIGYYAIDLAILFIIASLSYRIARASQMVTQYPWLYRRTSPVSWESISS